MELCLLELNTEKTKIAEELKKLQDETEQSKLQTKETETELANTRKQNSSLEEIVNELQNKLMDMGRDNKALNAKM